MLVIKHQRIVCCLLFLMITAVTKAQRSELPATGGSGQNAGSFSSLADDSEAEGQRTLKDKRTLIWLRTNLLLPLMNVGLELPIGNRWSVGADWYYPWIPRYSNAAHNGSSHKNCYQVDGLSIEGRYWLGSKHKPRSENKRYRLLGHSVGLFAMGGRYDWEHNYRGYQGEYIIGGVDYLYAKTIFRGAAHLELSLGLGYFYSKATRYEVFERGGAGYRDKNFRKVFRYFGPAKANVTLVFPIKDTRTKTKSR